MGKTSLRFLRQLQIKAKLHREVANLPPLYHVNHILRYIFRVISNTLDRSGHQYDIQRCGKLAGLFHHIGDEVTQNCEYGQLSRWCFNLIFTELVK